MGWVFLSTAVLEQHLTVVIMKSLRNESALPIPEARDKVTALEVWSPGVQKCSHFLVTHWREHGAAAAK